MDFVNKQIKKSIAHVRKLERAPKNAHNFSNLDYIYWLRKWLIKNKRVIKYQMVFLFKIVSYMRAAFRDIWENSCWSWT